MITHNLMHLHPSHFAHHHRKAIIRVERALQRVLHLILIFSFIAPTVSGVVEAQPPDINLSPDPLSAPAQVTVTPETPTPEPTVVTTDIPTLEPTGTDAPTLEPTTTATATTEATSTASPTPTETATPAPTASAIPTLDPTVTVTPTEPGLTFNLSVAPANASVGDVVTFTAQVHNGGTSDLPVLTFVDDVPVGLTFLPESNPVLTYDPTQNILTATLPLSRQATAPHWPMRSPCHPQARSPKPC